MPPNPHYTTIYSYSRLKLGNIKISNSHKWAHPTQCPGTAPAALPDAVGPASRVFPAPFGPATTTNARAPPTSSARRSIDGFDLYYRALEIPSCVFAPTPGGESNFARVANSKATKMTRPTGATNMRIIPPPIFAPFVATVTALPPAAAPMPRRLNNTQMLHHSLRHLRSRYSASNHPRVLAATTEHMIPKLLPSSSSHCGALAMYRYASGSSFASMAAPTRPQVAQVNAETNSNPAPTNRYRRITGIPPPRAPDGI